ncbi:MAG: helix-turn-helix transcriptional regulator [Halolamina sp.]
MRCAVAVVALLLAAAAVTGGAVAQEGPDIDGPTATTFDVRLQANGDARWVVQMSFPLDTGEERDAFRAYAAEYEAGDVTAGPGVRFFRTAAASASEVAGREMRVVDVARDSSLGPEAGTLQLSFTWTAFLGQDGDRYVLRDALRTPEGTWLQSLETGQRLRIHTPPGYDIVQSIEARQANESLVITGPESFDPDEFVVAYEPAEPRTRSETETPTPEPDWGVVATGLLGLLLVVVVVVALWRWRGSGAVLADESGDGSGAEAAVDGPTEAAGAGEAAAESGDDGVDPELLSDEERVEHLLEQNGGRMRQADIVSETDWSDAKVSQLLSRMAEEGSVEKLRLGRENVISLPDGEQEET